MKLTEREKVYHDGYKQGRFDEYAERMGIEPRFLSLEANDV